MLQFISWQQAWALLALVLAGGLIMAKLTERPKIPDVVGYLLLGIVIGPTALHLISVPSDSTINQMLVNLGATMILFEGGMGIQLRTLRKTLVTVVLLATLGVIVTAFVVGVTAHFLLSLPWDYAFLLAAIIASTDPATLIPVFKRVRVYPRLQQTVEAESAFNDATAAVLFFTLLEMVSSGGRSISVYQPILQFFIESGIGLMIGLIGGYIALLLTSKKSWGIFHEYGSIVMFITAMGTFLLATVAGGSGFMAAFAAGLISGNGKSLKLPLSSHTETNIQHFYQAITFIFRTLIFVLLGSQVDFRIIVHYLWPALGIVLVLMFIARPLTVAAGVLPSLSVQWKPREYLFMCWTRETGVIPAALSSMLTVRNIPHMDSIRAVTFVAIIVTILLQASTTGLLAKKLNVLLPSYEKDI